MGNGARAFQHLASRLGSAGECAEKLPIAPGMHSLSRHN